TTVNARPPASAFLAHRPAPPPPPPPRTGGRARFAAHPIKDRRQLGAEPFLPAPLVLDVQGGIAAWYPVAELLADLLGIVGVAVAVHNVERQILGVAPVHLSKLARPRRHRHDAGEQIRVR